MENLAPTGARRHQLSCQHLSGCKSGPLVVVSAMNLSQSSVAVS